MKDTDDRTVQLLARLVAAVEGQRPGSTTVQEGDQVLNQGDTTVNRNVNVDYSEVSQESTASSWYTSGPAPVVVSASDETWEMIEFGFPVSSILIRYTEELQFAVTSPSRNGVPSYLPTPDGTWGSFEVGGDPPLGTAFLWVRVPPSSTTDAKVLVEAY